MDRRSDSSHFTIDVERHGADVLVRLSGDLDTATAGVVGTLLGVDADGPDRTVVVDLGGVSTYDSAALAALLRIRQALDEGAATMTIQSPPPSVLKLAPLAGLDGMCGQPSGGRFEG